MVLIVVGAFTFGEGHRGDHVWRVFVVRVNTVLICDLGIERGYSIFCSGQKIGYTKILKSLQKPLTNSKKSTSANPSPHYFAS